MRTPCAIWLLASLTGGVAAQDLGRARYQALVDDYVEAAQDYLSERRKVFASTQYKQLRKARDSSGMRKLTASVVNPAETFAQQFMELAKAHEGKAIEADCLVWVVLHARNDLELGRRAVQGVIDRHINTKAAWALSINWFRVMPIMLNETTEVFRTIAERSEHAEAVAEALWAQKRLASGDRNLIAKLEARIREEAPDSTPALRLLGKEFRKSRLQTGMAAPDIVGKDIDGHTFKLSDYRGKVVVLDFWGDW